MGRDTSFERADTTTVVSIHAPAWGATASTKVWLTATLSFYPRARVGRDPSCSPVHSSEERFLSTRPRGARQPLCRKTRKKGRVSIHAPAWGATLARVERELVREGFYPRARVGRDDLLLHGMGSGWCFYPRARVGRDVAWYRTA